MHKISIEEAKKISEIRNTIKDKKEDKRLHGIQLRGQGKSNKEIAEKLDTSIKVVNNWICKYVKEGIEGLLSKGQKGNHRNLTFEQEEEMLKKFEEKGKKGQIITVKEIEEEYVKLVGHSIGTAQIYYVLKRHGWRKVMPRSRHPKKANQEVIEASKKLTVWQKSY